MGSADLRSVDALLQLRGELLRFREATSGIVPAIRLRAQRAKEEIRQQLRRLDDEIDTLSDQIRFSDDDDDAYNARRELENARADRDLLRDRLRRLTQAASRHDAASTSWTATLSSAIPAAAAFLAQKHSEAMAYLQTVSEGMPGGGSGLSQSSLSGGTAEIQAPRPVDSFSDPVHAADPADLPPLPGGFVWIPITSINVSELPSTADYLKVGYGTMQDGLNRLWTELIPMVQQGADRSALQAFDEAHGRYDPMGFVHPESLAHLWDQFLERSFHNHIRVTFETEQGRWSVDNGRHRIKAAQDLGWKYVPGEFVVWPPAERS